MVDDVCVVVCIWIADFAPWRRVDWGGGRGAQLHKIIKRYNIRLKSHDANRAAVLRK